MIDWSRVEELQNDLGADDFAEVTAIFLEEVEERLEQLESRISSSLTDDFHFLKGCAANLGFAEFQKVCADGEMTGDAECIGHAVKVYSASKSEFLEHTS